MACGHGRSRRTFILGLHGACTDQYSVLQDLGLPLATPKAKSWGETAVLFVEGVRVKVTVTESDLVCSAEKPSGEALCSSWHRGDGVTGKGECECVSDGACIPA